MEKSFSLESLRGRHIHFIGCGGAGMCCLALICRDIGSAVSGSDIDRGENVELLERNGIRVAIGHSEANLPAAKLNPIVVRSAAVRTDNPEFRAAFLSGSRCYTRGEFLAVLADGFPKVAAVAGSHGKTSVAAMLTHILSETGRRPGHMIGGKVCGWKSPGALGSGEIFVTESDESDGSLTLLKSTVAVVTNIDDDHSWSVGGEEKLYANFAIFGRNSGRLICYRSGATDTVFSENPGAVRLDADLEAAKISRPGWGFFQRSNAALAVAAAARLGVLEEDAIRAVLSFPGVERRMSIRYSTDDFSLVEDYAHHPTEISATIGALRESFPGRRLRIVFQPHRQARLEKYLDRFACELRRADEVTVVPVFAAWTETGGHSSRDLAERIGPNASYSDLPWKELADRISSHSSRNEVLAVIGAGDICELVNHLREALQKTE